VQRTRRVAVPLPAGLSGALRGGTRPRDASGVAASFVARREGGATLLLWSTPPAAAGATPIGTVTVRWDPGDAGATIRAVAWSAPRTEDDVWRAIEALAGAPVRRRRGGDGHPVGGTVAAAG
jgi:hypothetical protein